MPPPPSKALWHACRNRRKLHRSCQGSFLPAGDRDPVCSRHRSHDHFLPRRRLFAAEPGQDGVCPSPGKVLTFLQPPGAPGAYYDAKKRSPGEKAGSDPCTEGRFLPFPGSLGTARRHSPCPGSGMHRALLSPCAALFLLVLIWTSLEGAVLRKAGRSPPRSKNPGDGKSSRLGPRFEALAKG